MSETTPTPTPTAETVTVTTTAQVYPGMGPMFLRETLAKATEGEVSFEITRVMPLGLHVRATRGDQALDLVVDERALIEAVCTMARDRLPKT